jgi:hypothetical protein
MLNHDGFVLTKWRTLYGAGYLLPKGTGRVTEESRAGLRLAGPGLGADHRGGGG